MKNILVLGGTGAMGKHLVQLLAERGEMVSVTTRVSRQSSATIEFIHGNAKDESFLSLVLARKWDAIIDFMVYDTPVFEQRAGKLLAATSQYIFLSSSRVYADSSEPIQENSSRLLDSTADTEFLATDEYSLAKARQEDILKESNYNNWTIIRPYITYSEQRLQLGVLEKEGWLYRALKGRTIVFSEDIVTKLTTLTYGLDVAAAIAALIGEVRALGQIYQITQSEAATWGDVLNVYLKVLETKLGKRPKVMFLGLDDFSRCKRAANYQLKYDRLLNRTFNNSKVAEFIDINNFIPLEQGLTQCLEQFLDEPNFLPIDWRLEAVKDRYCNETASLSELDNWKQKIRYLLHRFITK